MVQVIAINMIDLWWWERPVRHPISPDRSENPEFGVVKKSDLAKTLLSGEKAMIPRPVFCANILFFRSFVTMSRKGHCVTISRVSCDWCCEPTMQLSCLKNKLTSSNQDFWLLSFFFKLLNTQLNYSGPKDYVEFELRLCTFIEYPSSSLWTQKTVRLDSCWLCLFKLLWLLETVV